MALSTLDNQHSKGMPAALAFALCSYVPVEVLDALGFSTVRLVASGTVQAESDGERLLGAEACSWCKSSASTMLKIAGTSPSAIFVGCTSCDQARRTADTLGSLDGLRVLLVNSPATRSDNALCHYVAEVREFAAQLEEAAGRTLTSDALRDAVLLREARRARLRALRPQLPHPAMLAEVLADMMAPAGSAQPAQMDTVLRPQSSGIPVLLAGGAHAESDMRFAELLVRSGFNVVADLTCTGERYYDFEIPLGDDLLASVARAYFHRPPCIWTRPNSGFFDYALRIATERGVRGVIWKAPRFCDVWNFEVQRARERFGLPLLHLDATYSEAASARTVTRVEAFAESLV